ncbi:MAG: hypothetical protein AB7P04_06795 [Bacteriovoracia bacterium]
MNFTWRTICAVLAGALPWGCSSSLDFSLNGGDSALEIAQNESASGGGASSGLPSLQLTLSSEHPLWASVSMDESLLTMDRTVYSTSTEYSIHANSTPTTPSNIFVDGGASSGSGTIPLSNPGSPMSTRNVSSSYSVLATLTTVGTTAGYHCTFWGLAWGGQFCTFNTSISIDPFDQSMDPYFTAASNSGQGPTFTSNSLSILKFKYQKRASFTGTGSEAPQDARRFGNQLVFSAELSSGVRKLHTISQVERFQRMLTANSDSVTDNPKYFHEYRGNLYYTLLNGPYREIYRLDSAGNASKVFSDRAGDTGEVLTNQVVVGTSDNKLIFGALTDSLPNSSKFYAYEEGAGAGAQFFEINASNQNDLADHVGVTLDGYFYFYAFHPQGGAKLMRRTPLGALEVVSDTRSDLTAHDVIREITVHNGKVFFTAKSPNGYRKLYTYDPSASKVYQVSNTAGAGSDFLTPNGNSPTFLHKFGDALFVTAASTNESCFHLYKVVNNSLDRLPPTNNGGCDDPGFDPRLDTQDSKNWNVFLSSTVDSRLYFAARNHLGKFKLHSYDGTSVRVVSNTARDTNLPDAPRSLVDYGGAVYFGSYDATGAEKAHRLYEGEIQQMTDLQGNSHDGFRMPVVVGDFLYFFGYTDTSSTTESLYQFCDLSVGCDL